MRSGHESTLDVIKTIVADVSFVLRRVLLVSTARQCDARDGTDEYIITRNWFQTGGQDGIRAGVTALTAARFSLSRNVVRFLQL
jgi:hypothetical protein